ncbi:hypothetical protein Kpol_1039p63 [Vanderwaltozyma polyspora DSM 70294]|uniref:AN1-type domain-containing protein n=1 Tax=Vanderwaltozyma polyspora (strain ATCC 22028 / DSM 70294 / BCRC 21397 / CBS 2163 / NBRC 10782 / NRRL Y-8283 / UCD 57-17) TaxID=436907 RepID=A7THI8_VANPO|nr:uncharacterized protein Kpol_1039p63 [Vanderwaltozyma polyspora DSM 70294]EDO18312.1 hypothetical protein Kpol_1039p63 [Vanderwaltozyma polyspora DSM 70294]
MEVAVERETGMLDVGTHCQYCRQIDFLPFHCSFCKQDFCTSHRTKESHHCKWLLDQQKAIVTTVDVVNENGSIDNQKKKKKKRGPTYFESLLPEKSHIRVKQQSGSVNHKMFGIDKSTVIKVYDNNKLSNSIPEGNRVQVRCYLVDKRRPFVSVHEMETYVNKMWPVGRAIDQLSRGFSNIDTKTKETKQLYLEEDKALDPNDRVDNTISNNDTLYLVLK